MIFISIEFYCYSESRERERELQSGRISNYVIPTGDIFSIETLTTEREETRLFIFLPVRVILR